MKYANLTRAQQQLYIAGITTPGTAHQRIVEMTILTLDGAPVTSLIPRNMITGQIDLNAEADPSTPSRTLSLDFLDPHRALVFEPDQTDDAPLHQKYKIQIIDSRYITALGMWVDVVVFTGPLFDFDRTGPLVSITAQGTERLAMGSIRRVRRWLKRTRKTTVIDELLAAAGWTDRRIPDLPERTSVHIHVGTTHPTKAERKKGAKPRKTHHRRGFTVRHSDTYWGRAVPLAESEDRHLYADAEGVARLRTFPERPIFHFTGNMLISDVKLTRPGYDGPNIFIVTGAKPKASKHRVSSGKIGFPASHPLSAQSRAWHGQPAEIIDQAQNPHVRTVKRAIAIAVRKRDRAVRILADASFDAVPIPPLMSHEYDMVTAQASWGVPTLLLTQLSYPLTPDDSPMTVGARQRVVPPQRHGRKRSGAS